MNDDDFMRRAIALSEQALANDGLRPFGAVVVRDGTIVGEGVNATYLDHDPTAHGEIVAIRAACATLQTASLKGCTIYTSCEPCSMCTAAILAADLDAVVYGAALGETAEIYARRPDTPRALPLDSMVLRTEVSRPIEARLQPSRRALPAEALAVIDAYSRARTGA
ncbi:nucleoside deaminase [Acuticoccus mangrovi]|uniref:Nucleoside deaminase n=1 Tax=Acuticoccus mangrovi TaxID=2796142 RepID=A0A934IGN8_9HYPH|nr:nucleoside deaminase [Acuticoccus mangrovi]MBJ3774646.1 nucleoside deaminase [Acuticoccus mangrovi]